MTTPRHPVAGGPQGRAFGRTCPSGAQIGRYVRGPVAVHGADPRAPEAASCLIALIASSPEVAAMRGFRDALRADPLLRRRYAALKRTIVEDGPIDPVAFTRAKHDWITATLSQLGLVSHRQHRLYDDPDLNRSHRLAS